MELAFYLSSTLLIVFALGVIINRNPVSSAFSLVAAFLGLAALFITLNAYLIGTLQILVYAGAIMVLFLFIIMLMDVKEESNRKLNYIAAGGGFLLVTAFLFLFITVLDNFEVGQKTSLPEINSTVSEIKSIGILLFTDYIFHLQVMGILLLMATIGVITLSRRHTEISRSSETD